LDFRIFSGVHRDLELKIFSNGVDRELESKINRLFYPETPIDHTFYHPNRVTGK